MNKDLGKYHLKVELIDGKGWFEEWDTGWRFCGVTEGQHPLDVIWITPTYSTEEEVFTNMIYMYTEGNFSCDCNKSLFWQRASRQQFPELDCGNTMKLKRLTAIRPDRTEVVLWLDGVSQM